MSPVIDRQAEQARLRLSQQEAAAWEEYGSAVRSGASRYRRRLLFDAAMHAMNELAAFEGERGSRPA